MAEVRTMHSRAVDLLDALLDDTDRPVLFDVCCKAGGATRGYQQAGFFVVGCDIEPQPNYCGDWFIHADALEILADFSFLEMRFDAIHVSPPCQGYSTQTVDRSKHPRLIAPVRELLNGTSLPYVIENVEGARTELRDPVRLCGSSFDLDLRRHRYFETNWPLLGLACHHAQQTPRFRSLDMSMVKKGRRASVVGVHGHINYAGEFDLRCKAMGIDWMTNEELVEAIPPAYTEWIGHQLMAHLRNAPLREAVIA